ncbi:MAG: PAS domain-containing protein [Nitrospirae bacterium]|nr:PAS domain-containing protein [Nitrospirota bacterium]
MGADIFVNKTDTSISKLIGESEQQRSVLAELQAILDNLPIGIAYIDKDYTIIKVNKFVCKHVGFSEEELPGHKCFDMIGEYARDNSRTGTDKICSYCLLAQSAKEKRLLNYEFRYKDFYMRKTVVPEYDENGELYRFLEIVEDITNDQSRQLLESIAHGITDEIMLLSDDFKILWANNATLNKHACTMSEIVGKSCFEITSHHACSCRTTKYPCPIMEWNKTGTLTTSTHIHTNSDGTQLYVEVTGYPILDLDGRVSKFVHLAKDITTRISMEDQLRESIAEKEILLRELHHRSKNNMTMISSILGLQAMTIEDEKAKRKLLECQDRIRAMSLVHEILYKSESLQSVNLSEYLKKIIPALKDSYDTKPVDIITEIEDSILLDIDTAIPLGIVINELITNAYKYAFTGCDVREIGVTARKADDIIHISVRDNGIGMQNKMDFDKVKTMGLKLINILIKQMHGSIEANVGNGTEFHIKIKPRI